MLKTLLSEIDSSPKKVKQFAWLFAVIGLLIIPGIVCFKHGEFSDFSMISVGIGTLFLVLGFVFHKALVPLYKIWMLLALVLGLIMTKVIVTLVFYLIMTPIGLIKRSDLKKSMHLNFDKKPESYWVKKEWNTDPKRLEKLF
ncbi:hypothetical protein EP331_11065 [bacterium]|nr:MAG: hypothetical protein EP331_11065 [bacterium]